MSVARPQIVVDPGSHALLNAGDVAMLQVCLARLEALWPQARLRVLTTAPDVLARVFPAAEPLPAQGRYSWFREGGAADPPRHGGAALLARAAAAGRHALRPHGRALLRAELRLRGLRGGPAGALVDALTEADLLIVAGRGGLADAFLEDTLAVLGLLELAAEVGVPSAMVSQGAGPADDSALRERVREVLPTVAFVGVRERLYAPALLAAAGVAARRVHVTGDDSVERAFEARPEAPPDGTIGVSLRFAPYYETRPEDADLLRSALRELCAALGAQMLPVPISAYPHEADADAIAAVTGERAPAGPDEAIRRAGLCRVVATASYHAGVFALAQGVPVVGVARSEYQARKLHGLADLFGRGCTVVRLDEPGAPERLRRELEAAWREAPALREPLLESAAAQLEAGVAAYRRLRELVDLG